MDEDLIERVAESLYYASPESYEWGWGEYVEDNVCDHGYSAAVFRDMAKAAIEQVL